MFEKKKKKASLLDKLPSSYEDCGVDSEKVKKANRIYFIETDRMYSLSRVGVVSDIETDEFIINVSASYLKEQLFMNKIKLFFDKIDKKSTPRLPESLIVKHKDKEENDGNV